MEVSRAVVRAADTALAFDGVAHAYDRTNVENPILAHMRRRVLAAVRRHVPPGSALLDLGCGPGTDHAALAAAGYRVTGIDASPQMVQEALRRADLLPWSSRPTVLHRSIERTGEFPPASFDAALSNFGPLNCVDDLAAVAADLRRTLRPGGHLVASVIGRYCPWEAALYLARGDMGRAFLRLRRGPVAVPLQGRTVWTHYHSAGGFTRVFQRAGFSRRALIGLGVLAPPPYLEAFARRRHGLTRALLGLDELAGAWPGVRAVGDHFLVVLRRD